MQLFDLLEHSAAAFPDNLAVVHGNRKISYRELFLSSTSLGRYLSFLPLEKKGRVAILFENSIDYLISFFAVFRAGRIAVPIDTSLKPEKVSYVLSNCGASCLLVQAKFDKQLGQILKANPSIRFLVSEKPLKQVPSGFPGTTLDRILNEGSEAPPAVKRRAGDNLSGGLDFDPEKAGQLSPHELAAIFYTSGSTGSPKGVMLSHRNLLSNTVATVRYLKLGPRDRVLVILPFYYIYGNSLMLTHVATGGTLVIDNRFLYPEVVLDTMEREEVTGFSGVPSNFMILLNNSTFPSRTLRHLRYFTQAGGAMPPKVIKKLMRAFPDKEIYIMYGLTEASPRVSYVPPERLKDKVGSIGIPVPGVKMKIVRDDGTEGLPGEEGEIAVAGDNVMLGYWNDPEESSQVLKDGWLYTGDLGTKDGQGYFYVVARKKDIIKVGGNRVSAKEIEECILELTEVAEAAVVGVPDDILGEGVKAVVVLRAGEEATEKEIQSHCRIRLGDYKAPKSVEFVSALPKYQSGKVNKEMLRAPGPNRS